MVRGHTRCERVLLQLLPRWDTLFLLFVPCYHGPCLCQVEMCLGTFSQVWRNAWGRSGWGQPPRVPMARRSLAGPVHHSPSWVHHSPSWVLECWPQTEGLCAVESVPSPRHPEQGQRARVGFPDGSWTRNSKCSARLCSGWKIRVILN